MNIQNKVYLTLSTSFALLILALLFSYTNLKKNSHTIQFLEKDQINLTFYVHKLNYDIKKNQTALLQTALRENHTFEAQSSQIFTDIEESITKLQLFAKQHFTTRDSRFIQLLTTMNKRVVAYKLVQESLLTAIKEGDKEDIDDAIVGFNAITTKFSTESGILIELSDQQLYSKVLALQENNNRSTNILLLAFILAILLLSSSAYKFTVLHKNLQQQLSRAQEAEESVNYAQKQLLKYNEDLEHEVALKTKEIHAKVYTNFLTGLANRNKLLEEMQTQEYLFMALLNIDKFQSFNDVYGEEVGNIAIKLTADFLHTQVKNLSLNHLYLYHVGGDEFAIASIYPSHLDKNSFIQIIKDILSNYQKEIFMYEDQSFQFKMSSGIAYNGKKKILAYADMALKDAKKRNLPFSIFEDEKGLEKIHKEDMQYNEKLIQAFATDSIVSYFQPIVPISSKKLPQKYESLVRLIDTDGSVIAPFKFIEVAKKNRIYYKITNAVVKNTLAVVAKYQVPCSLNLSLTDISNERTMKMFFDTLEEYQFNELLTVELLETEDFNNYQLVYDFCIKVRSFGLKVALDDFGSGYSNFSHILNLPIDYIKIDASLISNIDRDLNARLMVETIVDLAKKLDVITIAEFVSSQDILNVITTLGVDYAQGYHLGKPEPIETYLS